MRETYRSGPDTGTVIAARGGDQRALDALLAQCVPLVYNIVGRALDGHSDVDDVVQETLLRIVRGLPGLRDPGSFRSWMVAIAVHQVRDREQYQRAARHHRADLETAEQLPDPGSDFAAVTILRLRLTDQRREVAEATRWLDGDDQALLALWWLEQTGELDRAELSGALGLSGSHAAVRVQRMKEQMESARMVVRALNHTGHAGGCAALGALTRGWDGTPSPLWRKRLARHVRGCAACGGQVGELLPMNRLLGGLPLLVPPAGLGAHVLRAVSPNAAIAHAVLPHTAVAHATGQGAAPGRSHAAHPRRPRGLRSAFRRPPVAGAAALAAAAVIVASALVAAHLTARPAGPLAADASPGPRVSTAAPVTPSAAPPSVVPPTTATPSRITPTAARPGSPSRLPAPAVTVPAAPSAKKGVGVWTFPGVDQALTQSRASWYYTWSTQHQGIAGSGAAGFVPMIWGAASVTDTALSQARANGPYLLGFNEPDMAAQSNMTVDQTLSLWPKLISAGRTLGSPAVAYGGDTPGGWLDRFMSGAATRGYRVDFIALHWYGGDFSTPSAVSQLKSYLQAVHDRYHKPIWLTEYALIDFSQGTRFPTPQQQASFVTASTAMLAALPFLQRYAWFGLSALDTGPSSGLFRSGAVATEAGRAFRDAH
ncbi:sigma-70 family RNA polymerase sigma factor [Streptomyces sp. H10-C2]|uniref:sigma-70 family RNA polymerase sigma factor n=1 Tax=unclassified Streptomyces TaxID=2593676 RepID=UPI0024B9C899|nr:MULTISPECIES: sigma-70 family RNA polymerase sigma factor [unclassified Streptomyces]MDJ0343581.1 sigma-70 family RNA polymerase sigma factor [Streptomyces sp. PH10-H1]MDJ0373171.1 sigma-70 family RNA polymerase sigma factor [Streptomyces sp. H10-C2]